jgi:hypothetical protein
MGINGISSNAASWAQFVKITQAARERNGGLAVDDAKANNVTVNNATTTNNVTTINSVVVAPNQNVYTSTSVQSAMSRRIAGGLFDAYA